LNTLKTSTCFYLAQHNLFTKVRLRS